ncbi:hypothetical protein HYW99_04220 [Candidatus Woesearchaeota archaeon]|nr:hypothetical protein [Candidatus Woesearchaeota archaeon]
MVTKKLLISISIIVFVLIVFSIFLYDLSFYGWLYGYLPRCKSEKQNIVFDQSQVSVDVDICNKIATNQIEQSGYSSRNIKACVHGNKIIYKRSWSTGYSGGSSYFDKNGNLIGKSYWYDMITLKFDYKRKCIEEDNGYSKCFVEGIDCEEFYCLEKPICNVTDKITFPLKRELARGINPYDPNVTLSGNISLILQKIKPFNLLYIEKEILPKQKISVDNITFLWDNSPFELGSLEEYPINISIFSNASQAYKHLKILVIDIKDGSTYASLPFYLSKRNILYWAHRNDFSRELVES